MAYTDWSVVAYEQPSVVKWNIIGDNFTYLKDAVDTLDTEVATLQDREITAGSTKVVVTNGDWGAGNPSIDLDSLIRRITISADAPGSPSLNDLWIDT